MPAASIPPLIAFAVLVYMFLMGPLVIVFGAALSDTTYLTFPPQGLSLRWFEQVFEISAFRRTMRHQRCRSRCWPPPWRCSSAFPRPMR
jgi:ABC-type spermidine/putrescine transport system permease subunit II